MITSTTANILLILLAVFLGAGLALTGFALGALVVFRTKREPHESLFRIGQEKGDAFVVDDYEGSVEDTPGPGRDRDPKADDPVPSIMAKFNEKFLNQYHERKAAEAN
jgi:hypothetical protein